MNLIQEINEQTNTIQELCDHLGVKREDIPQELLDEIWGGPRSASAFDDESAAQARAGRNEWVRDLAQQQAKQQQYTPTPTARPIPPQEEPRVGDFIKVGNQLKKVLKVGEAFGNHFAYHTPGEKGIMFQNLRLDKEVGGKRVFVPTR